MSRVIHIIYHHNTLMESLIHISKDNLESYDQKKLISLFKIAYHKGDEEEITCLTKYILPDINNIGIVKELIYSTGVKYHNLKQLMCILPNIIEDDSILLAIVSNKKYSKEDIMFVYTYYDNLLPELIMKCILNSIHNNNLETAKFFTEIITEIPQFFKYFPRVFLLTSTRIRLFWTRHWRKGS